MSEYKKESGLIEEIERLRARIAELEGGVLSPPQGGAFSGHARDDRGLFLGVLLDTIPSPIFYKNADGVYLGCNRAFEEYIGLSRGELVGKTVYDVAPKDLAHVYLRKDDELFRERGTQIYESRVRYADGSLHDVIFYKAAYNNPDGSLGGLVGVILDITGRKRTEEALRKSEQSLAHAFRIASLGTWEWDIKENKIAWSNEIYKTFGLERDKFDGAYESFLALVHPDDRERLDEGVRQALRGRRPYDIEYRITRPDGSIRYAHTLGEVIYERDGAPLRMLGIQKDITERRLAEERIRESEKELRSILANMQDTFYRTDTEGRIIFASPSVIKLLGYTPEEVAGKLMKDFYLNPDERESLLRELREKGGVARNFETRLRRKDGSAVWVSTNTQYFYDDDGKVLGVEGVGRDITAAKKTENAMRLLVEGTARAVGDEFFTSLVESLVSATGVKTAFVARLAGREPPKARTLALWVDGIAGNIEYYLKGTPCENIGKGEVCHFSDGVRSLFPDDEFLSATGARGYYGVPFFNLKNEVIGHLGVLDDKPITDIKFFAPIIKLFAARAGVELERQIAERQLRKLQNAIEQTVETIVITDTNGVIEYVNPAAEKITGYKASELVGNKPNMLKSGKHEDEFYRNLWKTIKAGKIWSGAVINRKKSGDLYYEEMVISPVVDEHGTVTNYVAVKRDVTERIKAEDELRAAKEQAEEATRMKDKFVSLVSHDLRSPISSVYTLLQTFETDMAPALDDKHRKMLKGAMNVSDGLIKLIDQLLNISMLQTGRIRPKLRLTRARAVIAVVMESLAHLAEKKGVRLVNEIPADMKFYFDMDLFGQVVQNLVSNAIKFCREGDTVTVFIPRERKNTIAVKDTGAGIDPRILPDLFRHEVRTTRLGTSGEKGTGLGLPMCRDIIEAHGGEITVESEEGKGSVFYIKLPRSRPAILLVDDQEVVRGVVRESLKWVDADVLEAENAEDALEAINESPPDLVIADLNMPGMSGYDLLEKIKGQPRTSSIPVIVLTSSGDMESKEKAFRLNADDFITKPVSDNELLPRVRRFFE